MQDQALSTAELSDVVGTIYDCALDPAVWPDAIREVCRVANFIAGLIDVTDLSSRSIRLQQYWNYDRAWIEFAIRDCAEESVRTWSNVRNLMARPLDEPLCLTREIPRSIWSQARLYTDHSTPVGYIDCVALVVLRERNRVGSMALSRHESAGPVTDRDMEVMQLLAPHIRRAVVISDVLNMQAIRIGTLEGAFDLLQAGVIFVDADCKVIHANRSAAAMLAKGSPVQSVHGDLRTNLPQATAALRKAVAVATEPSIGRLGIGVPVPQPDGEPAYVHVLPLQTGETRSRLAPRAAAAVFIAVGGNLAGAPAEAIATVFDLTVAEIRTVERLLAGRSAAEIADDLGLAMPTVRTHISNILAKTGTARQTDLILLATQLAAPVG
jgi:DNA-binding CsgD family transcriptional regulator